MAGSGGRLSKGKDNLYKSAKVERRPGVRINMAEKIYPQEEFIPVEDGELPFK